MTKTPTEMQIPDDVMEAAKLTYEGLPIVYDGWDEDEVVRCIARAIMAERERCAMIAEQYDHGVYAAIAILG